MERSAVVRGPDGDAVLSSDELEALSWALKLLRGSGPAARLVNAGGSFDLHALGQLATFVRDVEAAFSTPLEVWCPKYGKNVCLGSTAGWRLVQELGLRYLNRNVDPAAVFKGARRAKGDAHTLGDVTPLRDATRKLHDAVHASIARDIALRVDVAGAYENF